MSFGKMPLGNGFLFEADFKNEYFFEMEVAFCENCKMFQLVRQPDPNQMFHENYAFFSGTSTYMEEHFKQFADKVINNYLTGNDPFVIELGSNDGIMLKNFAKKNIKHLGIEPSKNVAKSAEQHGVKSLNEFFDDKLAEKIVIEHGKTDVFLAANVMCHIPNIRSVVKGIKKLLKPSGIVMFEDPYLGDVILKTSYDQIYDEHTFLFSATSIKNLFDQFDMELIDAQPQVTHGGSMRYVLSHRGAREVLPSVEECLAIEKGMGLRETKTFEKFKKNCKKSKGQLVTLLTELKSHNKRVVGYGATSKSTTILNYTGIGSDLIEFISDTTPTKQGKYTPGSHIPVKSYDEFRKNYPDYAVLFAWNHAEEIMAKEQGFIKNGGKWILFFPEVRVVQ